MGVIQFAVSAKTARLIGRENISDVNGAIIELIKNSYDADATCVYVTLNIPFPTVPRTMSYKLCHSVFGSDETTKVLSFYDDLQTQLVKKNNLLPEQENELEDLLFSKNSITIIDNGSGMTEEKLRTTWMNIGTNDKEEKRTSPNGRVKTGAKGIGRFALDKLSRSTTVITKNNCDSLKEWHIDWDQFETASLLEEVTATINECEGAFYDHVSRIARKGFKAFDNYKWDSGTIIILNPTREKWSENDFTKVNKNLRSIFPSSSSFQFDIYVDNVYYPKYSFINERFSLDSSEYDYKISASFDGKDELEIIIDRNEIDTRKLKTTIKENNQVIELNLTEFWGRDAFKKEPYLRSSFAKKVRFVNSVSSITKIDPYTLKMTGPFCMKLYFLKNTPSSIDIVKPVVSSRRKEVLNKYSGIKLYRDGFKVRPYGDEDGPSFDWLSLGVRAQKSPAAVSHPDGSWRVRSNQIIGEIRISKDGNPYLSDMANREGLATNEAFAAFKTIIGKVLEAFEFDRQVVFREFALWVRKKRKEHFDSERVISSIKQGSKNNAIENNKDNTVLGALSPSSSKENTFKEYEQTILELDEQRKTLARANKTLMLYSSAGVLTNTFSHEISRIMTQTGSRIQHLRYSINRLLGDDGYKGDPIFNPLSIIDQSEAVDMLLENWLAIIMSGIGENVFVKQELSIPKVLNKHISIWKPLLNKKMITINPLKVQGDDKKLICNMAEIDFIIIINNFMLNSAYFLEKSQNTEHVISIEIIEQEAQIVINLENNGIPLDGIFANNPDRIFEPGVSTKITDKGKGSGIGLWIARTLILDNAGDIHPIIKPDGFGLHITIPKTR